MFLNQLGSGDFNNETLSGTTLGSRTLMTGMQGADVKAYQELLMKYFAKKGVKALPRWKADGDFGTETMNWTVKLKKELGLSPSGIMTASDIDKLKSSMTPADRNANTTVVSNSSKAPESNPDPISDQSFVAKYGMYMFIASGLALASVMLMPKKAR